MTNVLELHKFLQSEFDIEARSKFARLRRVPDTHVRHFLDYYESLSGTNQDALADASTLWGTLRLAGRAATSHQEILKTHPAWDKWAHEMTTGRNRSYDYYSIPLLRGCVAQAKIDRAQGKPPSVTERLEEYAASIRSVKAPELRRHVRETLKSLFDAKPSKVGGGDWYYEGSINNSQITVNIDYGGRSAQLRYDVELRSTEPFLTLKRAGFEVALGAGFGDWDFITEENLSSSMTLLSEFVTYVAELPQRLPGGCLEEPGA